jgi:hypothetical protein
MLDQNDSIQATLSKASPTEPKDGIRPALRTRSVNDQDVNCTPWSAWMIDHPNRQRHPPQPPTPPITPTRGVDSMMTIRRLSIGAGYKYLLKSIAVSDGPAAIDTS